MHIANETRSDEERKDLTEHLHSQLDKLDSDTKRIAQELKTELQRLASSACDQLIAHLASSSTRARILEWSASECPDGDDWDAVQEMMVAKVNKRIRREVHDWDVKNGIFADIQMLLLRKFQKEFELMEDQLSIIEGGMVGKGGRPGEALGHLDFMQRDSFFPTPNFSLGQKVALGLALPILIPLGIVASLVALPVAGYAVFKSRMKDKQMLEEYKANKADAMSSLSDEVLEKFLDKNSLTKLIQTQLQTVTQNLDAMMQAVPKLIEADRALIVKLQNEREASEVSLAERYLPLYRRCLDLHGSLDLFYMSTVRKYDISVDSLSWDPTQPPVASGTFGDIYPATWSREKPGEDKKVAVKLRREHVDAQNVTDILIEEENLRLDSCL